MRNCDNEKQVKIVKLIDNVKPEALIQGNEAPTDDGFLYSEWDKKSSSSAILTNAVIQGHHHLTVQQAVIEASVSEGLTQGDLAEQLSISQLDAHSARCALSRLLMIDCIVNKVKKTRFLLNTIRAQFEQEQRKIRGLIQTSNEPVNDSISQISLPFFPSTNVQLEKDVVGSCTLDEGHPATVFVEYFSRKFPELGHMNVEMIRQRF